MSTTTIYAGEVSSGLVADYSNTIIVSGGTAVDTTIDYGAMSVFIAGAEVSNTIMSGGTLYASTGRIENTTMVMQLICIVLSSRLCVGRLFLDLAI